MRVEAVGGAYFKQAAGGCEPLFEVERDGDLLTVRSNCRGNPTVYEEGEMLQAAGRDIPAAEFLKLRRAVDVTFDLRIAIDGEGYVTSVAVRADEETMSEYGSVLETVAKRICSELRADRESGQANFRRIEGIRLTIGGR